MSDRILSNSFPESRFQIVGIGPDNQGHTIATDNNGNVVTVGGGVGGVTTVVQPTGSNLHVAVDSTTPTGTAAFAYSSADSTALEASHVIKASPGVIYGINGYNSAASTVFLQLHNTTTLPANTAVPVVTFLVPATSNFAYDAGRFGKFFSVGITAVTSTTGPTLTVSGATTWFNGLFI